VLHQPERADLNEKIGETAISGFQDELQHYKDVHIFHASKTFLIYHFKK